MPTRTSASEWCVPTWFLAFVHKFPKCEVAGVLLLVLVGVDAIARTGDVTRETYLRKLAVLRKRSDAVVDRTVRLIRLSVCDQRRDDVDHLRNVMRRTRRHFGTLHSQCVEVFPKRFDIRSGELVDGHAFLRSLV